MRASPGPAALSREGLEARLGEPVTEMRALGGGDLSQVFAIRTAAGRSLVAKSGGPVLAEARMLEAIAATGCPVPEVVQAEPGLLVMTRLAEGRAGDDAAHAEAGRAIARMHRATADRFGWPEDHAFGHVPCPAGPTDEWPTFWAERRLLAWPGQVSGGIAARLERLAGRLPDLLPARPPASLLHGDLWSGNVLFDGGFSGLIDPACYHGHAEVDLAMLTLFGAPPPAFREGYGAPEPGWEARRPIYQLWPALVHLRLFGAGYRPMVERLLGAAGV